MVSDLAPDSVDSREAGRSWGGGRVLFIVMQLFIGLEPDITIGPKALLLRSPRSPRMWDSDLVWLSHVYVLVGDAKNCLLSPHVGLKPHTSLHKDYRGSGHGLELDKTMSCLATSSSMGI
ncbi:hypothetical protein GUJ93_ZPchr0006g46289 [Zizania palustris]|uniref:Uncharacterized protein n=1 Tax=Zizania palustris TaxID=103762 RepID=A0A8J5SM89_ZIZPA|nr:hypothetical protein GUJ93_ZPchr0006g46289 [Zizania palustris]